MAVKVVKSENMPRRTIKFEKKKGKGVKFEKKMGKRLNLRKRKKIIIIEKLTGKPVKLKIIIVGKPFNF